MRALKITESESITGSNQEAGYRWEGTRKAGSGTANLISNFDFLP